MEEVATITTFKLASSFAPLVLCGHSSTETPSKNQTQALIVTLSLISMVSYKGYLGQSSFCRLERHNAIRVVLFLS